MGEESGGALVHRGGTIELPVWTPYFIDFGLRIEAEAPGAEAGITGPGKNVQSLFRLEAGNPNIELSGLTMALFKNVITVADTLDASTRIKLRNCTFNDNQYVVWRIYAADGLAGGAVILDIEGCVHRRNYIDYFTRFIHTEAWFDRCEFYDGGPECIGVDDTPPYNAKNGPFYITNCKFRNYTNNRSGDADGHFIRLVGTGCYLTNNDMEGLYHSGGGTGSFWLDTEAIRLECSNVYIDGIRAVDCGLQEGILVCKGLPNINVTNFWFEATPAYVAAVKTFSASSGCKPASMYRSCRWSNGVFKGFDMSFEFSGFATTIACSMTDVDFIDCPMDRQGGRLIDVQGEGDVKLNLALNNVRVLTSDANVTRANLPAHVIYATKAADGSTFVIDNCELAARTTIVSAWETKTASLTIDGCRIDTEGIFLSHYGPGSTGTITALTLRGNRFVREPGKMFNLDAAGLKVGELDIALNFTWTSNAPGSSGKAVLIPTNTGQIVRVKFEFAGGDAANTQTFTSDKTLKNTGGTLAIVHENGPEIDNRTDPSWASGNLTTYSRLVRCNPGGTSGVEIKWAYTIRARASASETEIFQ